MGMGVWRGLKGLWRERERERERGLGGVVTVLGLVVVVVVVVGWLEWGGGGVEGWCF